MRLHGKEIRLAEIANHQICTLLEIQKERWLRKGCKAKKALTRFICHLRERKEQTEINAHVRRRKEWTGVYYRGGPFSDWTWKTLLKQRHGLWKSLCNFCPRWLYMHSETASTWALSQEKQARATQGAQRSWLVLMCFPRERPPCFSGPLHIICTCWKDKVGIVSCAR